MKINKKLLIICLLLISSNLLISQMLAPVGYSRHNQDGIALVANEAIAGGTEIYINDNEYECDTDNFPNTDEFMFKWTVPAGGFDKGDVIVFYESSSTDNEVFYYCTDDATASTSNTTCGTISEETGNWSYGAVEAIYIYQDSDNDPTNGITSIISAYSTHDTWIYGDDPTCDYPNAIAVADGVSKANIEYKTSAGDRTNVTKSDLLDFSSNWVSNAGAEDFSVQAFTNIALPVELVTFNAKVRNNTALLSWQTATEENNHGFEIERSQDGRNWQTIGFVTGSGTTTETQSYQYTDEQPLQGINYYRLKQVDFDGQFEYSRILNVEYSRGFGTGEANNEVSIFPNPVQGELNITNGQGLATIYNLLGQPVQQFAVNSEQFAINTTDLPKGQYLLSIQKENGSVVTRRFTK